MNEVTINSRVSLDTSDAKNSLKDLVGAVESSAEQLSNIKPTIAIATKLDPAAALVEKAAQAVKVASENTPPITFSAQFIPTGTGLADEIVKLQREGIKVPLIPIAPDGSSPSPFAPASGYPGAAYGATTTVTYAPPPAAVAPPAAPGEGPTYAVEASSAAFAAKNDADTRGFHEMLDQQRAASDYDEESDRNFGYTGGMDGDGEHGAAADGSRGRGIGRVMGGVFAAHMALHSVGNLISMGRQMYADAQPDPSGDPDAIFKHHEQQYERQFQGSEGSIRWGANKIYGMLGFDTDPDKAAQDYREIDEANRREASEESRMKKRAEQQLELRKQSEAAQREADIASADGSFGRDHVRAAQEHEAKLREAQQILDDPASNELAKQRAYEIRDSANTVYSKNDAERQRDEEAARDRESSRADALRATLGGDTDSAKRIELQQQIADQRASILREQGEGAAKNFDATTAPLMQRQFDEDTKRRRTLEAAKSEDAVSDIRINLQTAELEAGGNTRGASNVEFEHAQDARIKSLREEAAATADLTQKQLLLNQAQAQEAAKPALLAARKREQERKDADELQDIQAKTAADIERLEGDSYDARLTLLRRHFADRIRIEEQGGRLEIAQALRTQQAVEEAQVRKDEERAIGDVQARAKEQRLRNQGMDYSARVDQVIHDANQKIADAKGDPKMQEAIADEANARLQGLVNDARQHGQSGKDIDQAVNAAGAFLAAHDADPVDAQGLTKQERYAARGETYSAQAANVAAQARKKIAHDASESERQKDRAEADQKLRAIQLDAHLHGKNNADIADVTADVNAFRAEQRKQHRDKPIHAQPGAAAAPPVAKNAGQANEGQDPATFGFHGPYISPLDQINDILHAAGKPALPPSNPMPDWMAFPPNLSHPTYNLPTGNAAAGGGHADAGGHDSASRIATDFNGMVAEFRTMTGRMTDAAATMKDALSRLGAV